jgi:hypothetical protein
VKNALSGIYTKVGVSTRLQLAVLLLRDRTNLADSGEASPLAEAGTSPAARTFTGSAAL